MSNEMDVLIGQLSYITCMKAGENPKISHGALLEYLKDIPIKPSKPLSARDYSVYGIFLAIRSYGQKEG